MAICCVINCKNKAGKSPGIRFFSIPTVITNQCDKTREYSKERRRIWLKRINRKDFTEKDIKPHNKVCSRHFLSGVPSKLFDKTNPDWAPSIRLGYTSDSESKAGLALGRHLRFQARILKRKQTEANLTTDCKTKIIKDEKGENNKADKLDNGALFDHFYFTKPCNKYINQKSEESISDNSIHIPDEPSVSEYKVNTASPTVFYETDIENECRTIQTSEYEMDIKNKKDAECMTVETSEFIVYLHDELIRVKKENIELLAEISGLKLTLKENSELRLFKEEGERTRNDNIALREEIHKMRNCISRLSLNEAALKTDNVKVKFYTGFPTFEMLMHVYNFIASEVEWRLSSSLNKFEEFLIVMIRFRLSYSERDLGYRFGVCQPTISRILSKWIPIIGKRLKCVQWPEKENSRKIVLTCMREVFGDKIMTDLEQSGKVSSFIENIQKIKMKAASHLPSENS